MSADLRFAALAQWLDREGGFDTATLRTASADASFRRYFRVRRADGTSWIAMDAPPGREDLATYLKVSRLLEGCGLHVPHTLAADLVQGFAVLEDLGDTHMLTALHQDADADLLYEDALAALARLQLNGAGASHALPPYDRATLMREMQLLPEWYCRHHLGLELTSAEHDLLAQTFEWLAAEALRQPQVFVHRDYHSRNLMVLPRHSPGVIDFQDALRGPVTYDPVSLLKDCYVHWPRARVAAWLAAFRARLLDGGAAGVALAGASDAQFLRWFDAMGLQRHLKVLGIFARLHWRDGKSGYLGDLPRTLAYVRQAAPLFPELEAFTAFVESRLTPGLVAANERARAAAEQLARRLA